MQKIRNRIIVALFGVLSLTACAFGPLVSGETARTVGKGNHELYAGYGMTSLALKWSVGVGDNLDLGLQWEALSVGVRAKYAFVQNAETGWSWAGALGVGSSAGGSHYYGDLIGSYLTEAWEPYLTLRVVRIKTDPVKFDEDKSSSALSWFNFPSYEYTYGQPILGVRYWIDKNWQVTGELSTLVILNSGGGASNAIVNLGFGYRF